MAGLRTASASIEYIRPYSCLHMNVGADYSGGGG